MGEKFWRWINQVGRLMGFLIAWVGLVGVPDDLKAWRKLLSSVEFVPQDSFQFGLFLTGITLIGVTTLPSVITSLQGVIGGRSANPFVDLSAKIHKVAVLEVPSEDASFSGSPIAHLAPFATLTIGNISSQHGRSGIDFPKLRARVSYCDARGNPTGPWINGVWLRSLDQGRDCLEDRHVEISSGHSRELALAAVNCEGHLFWLNKASLGFRDWENPESVVTGQSSSQLIVELHGANIRRHLLMKATVENSSLPDSSPSLTVELVDGNYSTLSRRMLLFRGWLTGMPSWFRGNPLDRLEALTVSIERSLMTLYPTARGTPERQAAVEAAWREQAKFERCLNGSQSLLSREVCDAGNQYLITLNGVISHFQSGPDEVADSYNAKAMEADARRLASTLGHHQGEDGKLKDLVNAIRRARVEE